MIPISVDVIYANICLGTFLGSMCGAAICIMIYEKHKEVQFKAKSETGSKPE